MNCDHKMWNWFQCTSCTSMPRSWTDITWQTARITSHKRQRLESPALGVAPRPVQDLRPTLIISTLLSLNLPEYLQEIQQSYPTRWPTWSMYLSPSQLRSQILDTKRFYYYVYFTSLLPGKEVILHQWKWDPWTNPGMRPKGIKIHGEMNYLRFGEWSILRRKQLI